MQVAEVIKDDLWPNPLKYFNNVSGLASLYYQFLVVFVWFAVSRFIGAGCSLE